MSTLLQDLARIEKDSIEKGGFIRGQLTKELQTVADKHNQTLSVVKNNYYRFIKGKVDENTFELYQEYKNNDVSIRSTYDDDLEIEYIVVKDITDYIGEDNSVSTILKTILNKKEISIVGELEPVTVMEKKQIEIFLESLYEYVSEASIHEKIHAIQQLLHFEVKPDMGRSIDESIAEYIEETQYKPIYRYGDIIKVRVIKLLPYGVIVQVVDDTDTQGLIHISEIRNGFVEDVSMYFEEGDVLDAKVVSGSKDGKVAFTTKGMKLPLKTPKYEEYNTNPVINSMPEELLLIKNDLSQHKVTEQVTENDPEDLKEIISYLNGIVGVLSPTAKNMLKDVIGDKGVFKFTIAMMEVAKSFQNDLGLLFLKEVQKKMSDSL